MRGATDLSKLRAFMGAIGRVANGPGRVYLVGGASALLLGIRDQTIDIDLKLDPEPQGIFEGIASLKEQLDLNIELASPDQFIPPLPVWRERSEFIAKAGQVEFYHYDFYSQALSKILRGHRTDLSDAKALVTLGKVDASRLLVFFEQIQPDLIRYPAVDPSDFRQRIENFLERLQDEGCR